MSYRLLLTFTLGLFVFCCGGNAYAASSELSERLTQAEADLKNARESLHVAHQELGEKTETIALLEKALEKSPSARRKKGGSPEEVNRLKRELRAANAKIRSLEEKVEVVAVAAAKKREDAANAEAKGAAERKAALKKVKDKMAEARKVEVPHAAAAPEIFRVIYDSNSAASLDGRGKALKWVESKLKKKSGAKFEIQGQANDTKFEEANRAIAENRAKFLASFLRVSGVPPASIVSVSGAESSESGADGRIVEVIGIP